MKALDAVIESAERSMASHLDLIRDIQKLDERIDELETEIGRLPKQVAEIERALESHTSELAAQKGALEANEAERRRLEGEISLNQVKADRLQTQISDVKTNDQYRALRNEIAFARKEIKKAEDLTIDKMEEVEDLTAKVEVAEKALAEESAEVATQVAAAEKLVDVDRRKLAKVQVERDKIGATMPPKLLKAYDRVRRKLRDRAVSAMSNGRCSSCNMLIRPQLQQDLRTKLDDVITCEFCGCILYWEDPEAVQAEDPAGESGVA